MRAGSAASLIGDKNPDRLVTAASVGQLRINRGEGAFDLTGERNQHGNRNNGNKSED